jgi:hypothetical protein
MYAFWPALVSEQAVRETFFYNSLIRDHKVNKGEKNAQFLIDGEHNFCIVNKDHKIKRKDGTYFAVDALDKGDEDKIPLWLFGFLY